MIEWTPIAVNEKPLLRGKNNLPEYSAAVIGQLRRSAVLRRRIDRRFRDDNRGRRDAVRAFTQARDGSRWMDAGMSVSI